MGVLRIGSDNIYNGNINNNGILGENVVGSRLGPYQPNFAPSNALVPYRAPSQGIIPYPRRRPRYDPPMCRPQIVYDVPQYRRSPPPMIERIIIDDYVTSSYGGLYGMQSMGNPCCPCFQDGQRAGMYYGYGGGLGYGGYGYWDPYMIEDLYDPWYGSSPYDYQGWPRPNG